MGALIRALQRPALQLTKYRTSPRGSGSAVALASPRMRRVGKTDAGIYRNWSIHSEFVRTAIDIRNGQLGTADWDITRFSRDLPEPDRGLMLTIRELLEYPCVKHKSFGSFITAVGEDLFTLDAGSIEKERRLNGELVALWPTDGALIKGDRFWDGNPREPRYWWEPRFDVSVGLLDADLIYWMMHEQTQSPIGFSYLETLKTTIDGELSGSLYNLRQVLQPAPDGVMDMGETARRDQVDAFRAYFETEVSGQSAIAFWGGSKGAKFIPFKNSNREMQFVEWQTYLARKIAVVFQLAPQDLGITFDVNRASSEVQQENSEDRGLRTVLARGQDYITTEVCWDPGWRSGRRVGMENNIAFRFREATNRQSLAKAQVKKITVAGMPVESINSARADMGWEPIGDPNDEKNPYNILMANTPQGLVSLDKIPTAWDVAMGQGGPDGTPQLAAGKQSGKMSEEG